MNTRPRLYLDVDGCLCPFSRPEPAWGPLSQASVHVDYDGGVRARYDVVWAPALVVALDGLRAQFDLELVWLTTWNEMDAVRTLLVPRLKGLEGGRILPFKPWPLHPGEAKGYWKAQRLLEDQDADPAPFIWIDDAEVELHGWKVLAATQGTASLMIPPYPAAGLLLEDVQAMEIWLDTQRKRASNV